MLHETQSPDQTSESLEYEFSHEQEGTINSLAITMRLVGLMLVVVGSLGVLGSFFSIFFSASVIFSTALLAMLLCSMVVLTIGSLTVHASRNFEAIVWSYGRDITHLMQALKKLRSSYRIQAVVTASLLALFVAAAAAIRVFLR